ncbi:hypothetical protein GWI33_010560, partial [Rhynchophorus ferrugineus]
QWGWDLEHGYKWAGETQKKNRRDIFKKQFIKVREKEQRKNDKLERLEMCGG